MKRFDIDNAKSLEGLVPLPWLFHLGYDMLYSKTARHAVASQAPAGAWLYFRCFPANTNSNLAFAAWQVANNYSVTKATKLLLFSLAEFVL